MLPKCQGVKILDNPVKFSWPNIDQRLRELEGSYWGYYACPLAPATASALYREQMPRPPYNKTETNWVSRPEGTLGVYYSEGANMWIYMWIVPQANNPQESYLIVAMANGKVFEPTCG